MNRKGKKEEEKKNEPAVRKILSLQTQQAWERWLFRNSAKSNGIQIRFFKKASGVRSITYLEALDEALCYGWIDGRADSFDEDSWIQLFTPRRKRSIWSKRNIEKVARLTRAGKMKPSGLEQVKSAKDDGRWKAAYDSPSKATIPDDFLKALSKNKKARKFFESLNKANLYSIAWRLQTAKKPETRERRMKLILDMMRKQEKFH